MRVIVCGSRRWHVRKPIIDRLYELAMEHGSDITIVHGGAKGVDRIACQEAQKAGLLVEEHLPAYDIHSSKRAPLIRNEQMAALGADLCVAFWDGQSTGTAHMMAQAKRYGIPVEVVNK